MRLRCPFHDEKTPSASLERGEAGTLRLHCFGSCSRSWDVHSLAGEVLRIDARTRFRELLAEEARLLGRYDVLDALEGKGAPRTPARPPVREAPTPLPERPYPPAAEVAALWGAGLATSDDAEAAAYLRGRSIEPAHVDEHELARVIAGDAELPRWATFKGDAPSARPWLALGFRLVLPTFDAAGAMRSVRAWRIVAGDGPKRLPPSGFRMGGLVLADGAGVAMLRGSHVPRRVLVVEGEPDFLSVTTAASDADEDAPAVLGIPGTGAWSDELAARIPSGARVTVATHADDAGDGYAEAVRRALAKRCDVRRRRR
jgi:DNA primase